MQRGVAGLLGLTLLLSAGLSGCVDGADSGDGPAHPGDGDLMIAGRWAFELVALLDGCEPTDDSWTLPEHRTDAEPFWFDGPVRCHWSHAGVGDQTVLAFHLVDNASGAQAFDLDLDGPIRLADPATTPLAAEPGAAVPFAIELETDAPAGTEVVIRATSASQPEAAIELLLVLQTSDARPVHVTEGDQLTIHYTVWDDDTEERLDEGEFPILAGDDQVVIGGGTVWSGTIKGFSWGAIGLDAGLDRGVLGSGTTHTILLPPELAYGGREGHELEHSWLRFEQSLREVI